MALSAIQGSRRRMYVERIGDRDWDLQEVDLDIYDDVTLWSENPRLQIQLPTNDIKSEEQLEAALQTMPGYDTLRKSIDDLGQMEPIYVQRFEGADKALVLEGATRVTILRELDRKYVTGIKQGRYRRVKVKLLPPEFGDLERTVLLARIHVRGSGVRAWGRYVEAKFIHDVVVGRNGSRPLMNVTQMAQYMEKSVSWVLRLKDAYAFAQRYIEFVDAEDGEGEKSAAKQFSVLEEVSKARLIGSQLREYDNPKTEVLRADVFNMVRNNAFKEYRDARFLKEFHEDPEKWEQLKSGEEHVASRLALEVKTNSSSVKAKIANLNLQVRRSLERDEGDLGEEEVGLLNEAAGLIESHLHPGIRPIRVALRKAVAALNDVSRSDILALSQPEVEEFRAAIEYFEQMNERHGRVSQ
ncbi:hypothetical protein NKJ16_24575 [Mesorhizobium sp. M0179]|uniref:hypothetical protein n=1 Tax=Mesorhizobium sp. M0179 TaxID=2956905 RepID=UPI00333A413C